MGAKSAERIYEINIIPPLAGNVRMENKQGFMQYNKYKGSGELYSQIEICASPEKIWIILTDFEKYPQWNPFITRIQGMLREGSVLDVHLQPPGGKGMNMKPVLLTAKPFLELRWKGRFIFRGLLDGEHVFEIKDQGNGTCLFVQHEYFSGLLLWLMEKMLMKNTCRGFNKMNEALKARLEQQ